jgi:quinol-cytochrome oxidoreductase complex cytochrome b subunit
MQRQCIGSIVSAQVLRRLAGRHVLVIAVTTFATIPTVIMILDKCTGGMMKKSTEDNEAHGGRWPADALFPLYCVCGVCYGMVEVVKRVIPRDIVGGDVDKLRQIDSLVS